MPLQEIEWNCFSIKCDQPHLTHPEHHRENYHPKTEKRGNMEIVDGYTRLHNINFTCVQFL